jgi:hypothetical protein
MAATGPEPLGAVDRVGRLEGDLRLRPPCRLARVMRCSIALSPTRKARAMRPTDRPETTRSASAICWVAGRSGWQADEQQAQDVVAVVGPSRRSAACVSASSRSDSRASSAGASDGPAAAPVDRGVAAHHDQPGGRVARRALLGPALERAETGVLEGLLSRVQVAEVAQQGADGLGPRTRQGGVDPGQVAHPASPRMAPPGAK